MTIRSSIVAALILLTACNPPAACPDCDGEDDPADQAEASPPDLPCGDVNLWTDDMNCGACGNECTIMWPGTQYEAGHCVEGECGPIWSDLFHLYPGDFNCGQYCYAFHNAECVPMGCSELTGLVCITGGGPKGDLCDLGNPHHYAHMDLTASCFERLPDPKVFDPNALGADVDLFARCCCERE
jgi:hypothetical protein